MIFKFDSRYGRRRSRLIVFLLIGICLFSACGKKTVATAANEYEANLMFDILHSNNFHVEKIPSLQSDAKTWEITVDEGWFGDGEAAAAIQVLRDYGLPRPPAPEVKNNDSLGIISDREEKERQRRDLQLQIENQLYTLADVIRASVIIAIPSDDILSLEKTPPSVSVSLVVKENQPKFTIEAVQTLVSADVPNLKPENVKVVITQQALREVPLTKLAAQRRTNQVFIIGGCLVILLISALGVILYLSKRRQKNAGLNQDEGLRTEENEADSDENEVALLEDGDDNE